MKKHQYNQIKLNQKRNKKALQAIMLKLQDLEQKLKNIDNHQTYLLDQVPLRGGFLIENVKKILEILETKQATENLA